MLGHSKHTQIVIEILKSDLETSEMDSKKSPLRIPISTKSSTTFRSKKLRFEATESLYFLSEPYIFLKMSHRMAASSDQRISLRGSPGASKRPLDQIYQRKVPLCEFSKIYWKPTLCNFEKKHNGKLCVATIEKI